MSDTDRLRGPKSKMAKDKFEYIREYIKTSMGGSCRSSSVLAEYYLDEIEALFENN